MSDFQSDIERQYETYCKIAEEHGFIDLNAKKNSFRCTTKSNEFNAGWIAFTGAVSAMRDDQQSEIDQLKAEKEKLELELSQTKQVLHNVIDIERSKVEKLKAEKAELEKRLKAVHALARMRSAVITADRWFTLKPHIKKAIKCLDRKEKALRGEHE